MDFQNSALCPEVLKENVFISNPKPNVKGIKPRIVVIAVKVTGRNLLNPALIIASRLSNPRFLKTFM